MAVEKPTWMSLLRKHAEKKDNGISHMSVCSNLEKDWRWVDFVNVRTGSPILCLEWVFRCRGLVQGRYGVTHAKQHAGKTALLLSFMGMAQKQNGRGFLVESENALPNAAYIASTGCDPDNMVVTQPATIGRALDDISQTAQMLRSDPAQLKLDPKQESILFYGLDSVSGFADSASNASFTKGESLMDQNGTLAEHAKTIAKFARNANAMRDLRMIVWFTAQPKTNILTGMAAKMAKFSAPKETFMAEKPLCFHASWVLNLVAKPIKDATGAYMGNMLTIRVEKNKLGIKRDLEDIPYIPNLGFDWVAADYEWMKTNFKPGCAPLSRGTHLELSEPGGRITCPAVLGSEKLPNTGKGRAEFLSMVYQSAPLIEEIRETHRVLGFGLPFERDWQHMSTMAAVNPAAEIQAGGAPYSEDAADGDGE